MAKSPHRKRGRQAAPSKTTPPVALRAKGSTGVMGVTDGWNSERKLVQAVRSTCPSDPALRDGALPTPTANLQRL